MPPPRRRPGKRPGSASAAERRRESARCALHDEKEEGKQEGADWGWRASWSTRIAAITSPPCPTAPAVPPPRPVPTVHPRRWVVPVLFPPDSPGAWRAAVVRFPPPICPQAARRCGADACPPLRVGPCAPRRLWRLFFFGGVLSRSACLGGGRAYLLTAGGGTGISPCHHGRLERGAAVGCQRRGRCVCFCPSPCSLGWRPGTVFFPDLYLLCVSLSCAPS